MCAWVWVCVLYVCLCVHKYVCMYVCWKLEK